MLLFCSMRNLFLIVCVLLSFFSAEAQTGIRPGIAQQQKLDSLRQDYKATTTDTARIKALVALADQYYELNDFKNALLYNDYVYLLSDKLKSATDKNFTLAGRRGEAAYYLCKGDVFHKQSSYRQALAQYFRALELYNELGDQAKVGLLLSNIATTYSGMGDYSESLNYSFKALKNQELLGNKYGEAVELNNIGAIYSDIHNFSKALLYNTKARNISRKLGDKKATALYTGNIGHCYQLFCDSVFAAGNTTLSLQLQDTAFAYYLEALKMSEEVSDLDNMAVCLENIGIMYSNIYDYKKALPYLLKALDAYKQMGLKAEQSYCLHMVGAAYHGLKQDEKAEAVFKQALDLARQTRSNYYLMEANFGNSEFYEKTNRPAKALAFYKDYISNRDSIFNRENTNAIARAELNYEFEKKQAEIKFKNNAIIYKLEADGKLNKQLLLFLVLIIALAAVLLLFARRAYANKKSLAEFMTAERDRKEVLLQEVHHRINNNLQIISSLLSLQASSAEDDKLYEYLKQSQNRIQSLSVLHELLYQTDAPLQINMKDYLDKVMDYHRDILHAKSVDIEMKIADVSFNTKMAVPIALIINELVTNSTKYAFENTTGGKIFVGLNPLPEYGKWMLRVSDTGKGIAADTPARKDSLGLRLINIMTKQIHAVLTKSNSPGATFEITFAMTD